MEKEDVVHTDNGVLLSHAKDETMPLAGNNTDGFRDYDTKRSESDRKRQVSYDITYTWNPKLTHMN